MNGNFSETEEAFLLSSLKEVVKVWGKGSGQASFNFSVINGKGTLQLGFQLGLPCDLHVLPPQRSRKKGPARCQRDRRRATAHQARVRAENVSDVETVSVSDKRDQIKRNKADETENTSKLQTVEDIFCPKNELMKMKLL